MCYNNIYNIFIGKLSPKRVDNDMMNYTDKMTHNIEANSTVQHNCALFKIG